MTVFRWIMLLVTGGLFTAAVASFLIFIFAASERLGLGVRSRLVLMRRALPSRERAR